MRRVPAVLNIFLYIRKQYAELITRFIHSRSASVANRLHSLGNRL